MYVITTCAVLPSFAVSQMHGTRMMTVQWIFSIKARIDRSPRVIGRAAQATVLARNVGCLEMVARNVRTIVTYRLSVNLAKCDSFHVGLLRIWDHMANVS